MYDAAYVIPCTNPATQQVPPSQRRIWQQPFYRVGFSGDWNFGKLEVLPFFLHGYENAYLGRNIPSNQSLPDGAKSPTWNSGFVEPIFISITVCFHTGRVDPDVAAGGSIHSLNTGDIDAYSVDIGGIQSCSAAPGSPSTTILIVKTKGAGVGANPSLDPRLRHGATAYGRSTSPFKGGHII